MLLAPSNPLLPPPHLGSSTEGLAEPAWEAIGKVQTATPPQAGGGPTGKAEWAGDGSG